MRNLFDASKRRSKFWASSAVGVRSALALSRLSGEKDGSLTKRPASARSQENRNGLQSTQSTYSSLVQR